MKVVKYILFTVIVLVLYWAIFNKDQQPLEIQQSENSVAQTSSLKDSPKKKLKQKIKKEIKKIDDFAGHKVEGAIQTDPDLTYLMAYRDYIYFGKCQTIFNKLEKKQDPVDDFIKRIQSYAANSWIIPIEIPLEVYPEQLRVFEDYLAKCQSLLLTEKEPSKIAQKRLESTYQALIPKTQEEIDLADGLALFSQHKALNQDLNSTKRGKTSLDDITANNIRQNITYLSSERTRLYESGNTNTDDDLKQRLDVLNNEVNSLNYQLFKDRITDQDEINYLQNKLDQSKSKLYDLLKKNTSPDLFLAFSRELFFPNFGVSGEVFNAINVHDHHFRREIYTIGTNLVACAMNYPCDQHSRLVQEICIDYLNPKKLACGKSLEDYYFTYLLGPNQLQDVENYLNYILMNYAKN